MFVAFNGNAKLSDTNAHVFSTLTEKLLRISIGCPDSDVASYPIDTITG